MEILSRPQDQLAEETSIQIHGDWNSPFGWGALHSWGASAQLSLPTSRDIHWEFAKNRHLLWQKFVRLQFGLTNFKLFHQKLVHQCPSMSINPDPMIPFKGLLPTWDDPINPITKST